MNQFNGVGDLITGVSASPNESGETVAKFSIAITRSKAPNDEAVNDYFQIRAKKNLGARCREYLHKGSKIAVTGKIRTYHFTGHEGESVSGFYVEADEVTFLPASNPNRAKLGDVHSDKYAPAHFDLGLDLSLK